MIRTSSSAGRVATRAGRSRSRIARRCSSSVARKLMSCVLPGSRGLPDDRLLDVRGDLLDRRLQLAEVDRLGQVGVEPRLLALADVLIEAEPRQRDPLDRAAGPELAHQVPPGA